MLAAEDQRVKGYVWEFLPRQTVLPDNDGKCESFEKQTNRQVEVKVLNPSIRTAKQLLTWECQCRVCSIIWSKLLNIAPRLWRLHSETDKEAQSPFPYQKDKWVCLWEASVSWNSHNYVLDILGLPRTSLASPLVWEMTLSFTFLASSKSPPWQHNDNYPVVWCAELKIKFDGNLETTGEFSMAFDEREWAKSTWLLSLIGTEWSALLWV